MSPASTDSMKSASPVARIGDKEVVVEVEEEEDEDEDEDEEGGVEDGAEEVEDAVEPALDFVEVVFFESD